MCNCRKAAPAPPQVPRTVAVAPPPSRAPVPAAVTRTHRGNLFRHARPQTATLAPAPAVSTAVWGPPLWRVLHGLSLLPDMEAQWPRLLEALDGSLPCADCARHFHAWLVAKPFSGAAVDYILALHNDVNRRTRKPVWTRERVLATYGQPGLEGVRAAFAVVRPHLGERVVTLMTELLTQDNGSATVGPVTV